MSVAKIPRTSGASQDIHELKEETNLYMARRHVQ